MVTRGYYPKGGGAVNVRVEPLSAKLKAITLTDRGVVTSVKIRAFHAGKVPRKVAEMMSEAAKAAVAAEPELASAKVEVEVQVVTESSAVGNGCGLLLVATTTTGCVFGGSALGKPKIKAVTTGEAAANELLAALRHGGCVDEWLQDQLILFMALAEGTSEMITGALTLHTKTAIMHATELCGASFDVEPLTSAPSGGGDGGGGGGGGGGIGAAGDGNGGSSDSKPTAYGQTGKEEGRFLIRCRGIGHESTHT